MISWRNDLSVELVDKENHIKRKLEWLKLETTKNKTNIKIVQEELLWIQDKQKERSNTK